MNNTDRTRARGTSRVGYLIVGIWALYALMLFAAIHMVQS